ncbi:MAG: DUF4912 domain-containing protein [Treponema sp.]|jgi:hypothetical protein|nr:DUF4912 domain-containing protein [Treponema sp.]
MDSSLVTRTYLETLSTADLIDLAEEYEIDIPSDLNRRFIIAELLEAAEYANTTTQSDLIPSEKIINPVNELPYTYNESQMGVVLRNPAWCFVYWDIRSADLELLFPASGFIELVLKVSFYESLDSNKCTESFDIPLVTETRELFVFLPADEKIIKLDLIAKFGNRKPLNIANSAKIEIPKANLEISSSALTKDVSPILSLSGLPKILQSQYSKHRQSFI